jgi:hypothetical protein
MPGTPPLVDAFLLVDQPRQRLGHWSRALGKLDSRDAPPLATISAYYDPTTDQALLGLRYDELALGPERLSYVVEVALLAETGMIQPGELSEGERKRFLLERLSRCTVQIDDQRNVVGALTELVRQLKEQKGTVVGTMPKRPPANPMTPRTATAERLAVQAKGTRDDLKKSLEPPPLPRMERADRRDEIVQETGATPDVHTADTQPKRIGTLARAASPATEVEPTSAMAQGMICARYLRGGKWVSLRVGALSLKGAALMSGALPRINDQVDVALSFGAHRALVRGAVGKVSTEIESQVSGAATFSVAFDLDDASRRQLTTLLTAARNAQITIKPPPPRATRRYPVEWPVALNTQRSGSVRAEALDISLEGMFVRPQTALAIDTVITWSSMLDDHGPPISGRAKVVRQVNELDAAQLGLATGFGLQIIEMAEADQERWKKFIARIERRSDKRVLIGASPARLAELSASLAGVGYAVMGGTDPGALVQLARQARPFDAVLIDAGWLPPGASASWIESLFSARNVPCLTLHGDSRRARVAIDKLLL